MCGAVWCFSVDISGLKAFLCPFLDYVQVMQSVTHGDFSSILGDGSRGDE